MGVTVEELEAQTIALDVEEARLSRTERAMQNATPSQKRNKYRKLIAQLDVTRYNLREKKRQLVEQIRKLSPYDEEEVENV